MMSKKQLKKVDEMDALRSSMHVSASREKQLEEARKELVEKIRFEIRVADRRQDRKVLNWLIAWALTAFCVRTVIYYYK